MTPCEAPGCNRPAKNAGACWTHYERRRKYGQYDKARLSVCRNCAATIDRTGTTGIMPEFCSPTCRVQGTRRPGAPECLGCGVPITQPEQGRARLYCRPKCRRHKGKRERFRPCADCGDLIDFAERLADGTFRTRASTMRCDACRTSARPHRYGMTAAQVADRDGVLCRWCGGLVDMTLVGSRNKWAPSVDHIIPWSFGGTNDPENLQLLHRVCNSKKGARAPQPSVGGSA